MGIRYNHGETKRNFQAWVKQIADDDLSERTDRILEKAREKNFGFTDQSGKLRGSIKKEKIKQPRVAGYRIVAGEGALGNDGNSYAAAVETGFVFEVNSIDPETGKKKVVTVPPYPYLNPALQAGKDK